MVSSPKPVPLAQLTRSLVVGGGPAGLTVANRLSEDPSITVLVLEAGPADTGELSIAIPAFIGNDIGGRYDWNLSTVPQVYLDGAARNIPQGRVLGGGTVLNGMLWNRGGQGDYQDWVDLGNPGWGWDDMLPYFQRSETYTPVYSEEIAEEYSIQEWPEVHGYAGPVNVSFPKFFWNSSAVLFEALNELGIPTAYDPNTGLLAGASFLPMDIDPVTEERSTARRAYYDPIMSRPNLWVSTEQTVTQLIFEGHLMNEGASASIPGDTSAGDGGHPGIPTGIFGGTTTLDFSHWIDPNSRPFNALRNAWQMIERRVLKRQSTSTASSDLRVIGVEYATNAGTLRQTVSATREVIVAAGALHSPQILMISGLGPTNQLESKGIPVKIDLPGVGSNLQE